MGLIIMTLKHARTVFYYIKYLPIIILYMIQNGEIKKYIQSDLDSWGLSNNHIKTLVEWFESKIFYRNLFYYRLHNRHLVMIVSCIYKYDKSFHINPDAVIDSCCKLSHPQGTFLNLKKMGRNCEILHNVTIGFDGKSLVGPSLGNNVFVGCGASVIGNLLVGDNAKIGANCVVVKDVPADSTVIGNPAYIVKLNGQKVNVKL